MSTITKERAKDILEFGAGRIISPITDHEIMEMARIALASLEAEAVAYTDAEELRFPHATSDMWPVPLGHGMDLALYTAAPAPVSLPDESAVELLATDLMKRIDKITGERHSVATLSSLRVSIVESCRAAMLQGADGNSPVIPDSWVACSERMPEDGEKVLTSFRGGMRTAVCKVVDVLGHKIFVDELTLFNGVPADYWQPLPAAPQQKISF